MSLATLESSSPMATLGRTVAAGRRAGRESSSFAVGRSLAVTSLKPSMLGTRGGAAADGAGAGASGWGKPESVDSPSEGRVVSIVDAVR
jgi:hypothetical protein